MVTNAIIFSLFIVSHPYCPQCWSHSRSCSIAVADGPGKLRLEGWSKSQHAKSSCSLLSGCDVHNLYPLAWSTASHHIFHPPIDCWIHKMNPFYILVKPAASASCLYHCIQFAHVWSSRPLHCLDQILSSYISQPNKTLTLLVNSPVTRIRFLKK